MATKKRKRFSEGGITEDEDKKRGLEASKDDKVGFFERLRMGNIDQEGSEAYRRFGAGRGKAERVPVEDRVATPVTRPSATPTTPEKEPEMDELEAANKRKPIDVEAGPRAEPPKPGGRPSVNVQAGKPSSSKVQEQSYRRTGGATAVGRSKVEPPVSNKYPESRGSVADSEAAELRRRVRAGDQAVERVTPETSMLPGGSLKGLSALAKSLAGTSKGASAARTPAQQAYDRAQMAERLTPARRSSASAAKSSKDIAAERARDLAEGQAKTKFTSTSKKPSKRTKKFDDAESNVEFKRGGLVSNASKRADGIATKGKTRCKMR